MLGMYFRVRAVLSRYIRQSRTDSPNRVRPAVLAAGSGLLVPEGFDGP
jgi:hypothetical protein